MTDNNMSKSCGNCVNCKKHENDWTCENVFGSEGWPCDCSQPNDDACENWSDNPADKDKAQDALRYFVDHFWDNNG